MSLLADRGQPDEEIIRKKGWMGVEDFRRLCDTFELGAEMTGCGKTSLESQQRVRTAWNLHSACLLRDVLIAWKILKLLEGIIYAL